MWESWFALASMVIIVVVGLLIDTRTSKYNLGVINYKETSTYSSLSNTYYYFHVLVKTNNNYKTKRVEVTKELFDSFEVDDKISIR